MGNLRVQQHIVASQRNALSAKKFASIAEAFSELRYRVHIAMLDLGVPTRGQSVLSHPQITIGADVVLLHGNDGKCRRKFSLVLTRGGEPVPFDHILIRDEDGKLIGVKR